MTDLKDAYRAAKALKPAERLRLIAQIWESLSPEHWLSSDDTDVEAIKQRWAKFGAGQGGDVPWSIVEMMLADCARAARPKVYSAPRRFDLATIFVVTTAYALLFAVLGGLNAGVVATFGVAGFITFVGIGQAVLFRGRRPRVSSMSVGVGLLLVAGIGSWFFMSRTPGPVIVMIAVQCIIYGVILGYVAGAMVGGVFLVADALRGRLARRRGPLESLSDYQLSEDERPASALPTEAPPARSS